MTDNLSKISGIIGIVLIVIAVIVTGLFHMDLASVSDEALLPDNWVNVFLKYAYFLIFAATIIAVGFGLFSFAMRLKDEPKRALMGLIPLVIIALVVIVAYSSASDVKLPMENYEGPDNVPGTLKWSGAGLYTTYALFIGAVVAIIYAEISKLIK